MFSHIVKYQKYLGDDVTITNTIYRPVPDYVVGRSTSCCWEKKFDPRCLFWMPTPPWGEQLGDATEFWSSDSGLQSHALGFLWPWNRDAVTQHGALVSQRGDDTSSSGREVCWLDPHVSIMWFQVKFYLPMRAMYILINRGKQGATMSRKKKVSILCSHNSPQSVVHSYAHFISHIVQ